MAAAEREPGDPGRRDDPGRHGEVVRLGSRVHLAPDAAASDPHRGGLRVDDDGLHRREVDDDAVVGAGEAAPVVAAAAHRERHVLRAREADRGGDVVGVAHRAMSAGRLSIIALKRARASSYRASSGPISRSSERAQLAARGLGAPKESCS